MAVSRFFNGRAYRSTARRHYKLSRARQPASFFIFQLITFIAVSPWIISICSSCSAAALVKGSIYALIALGYTMVYGIIQLINFAHGEIYMIGAFAALIVAGVTDAERSTAAFRCCCWRP